MIKIGCFFLFIVLPLFYYAIDHYRNYRKEIKKYHLVEEWLRLKQEEFILEKKLMRKKNDKI